MASFYQGQPGLRPSGPTSTSPYSGHWTYYAHTYNMYVTYVTSYVQKDLELVFNQGNVSSFWAFESTFEVKNTVIAGFRHLMAQVSHFMPL